MRAKARVVFDTNVVVSAFLFPNSVPGRLLFQSNLRILPLVSASLVAEIHSVLRRPKIEKFVSKEQAQELLAAYLSRSEIVRLQVVIEACRDPRDNHILELAVSGGADSIVTGDDDLLAINPFQGIAIFRPADFQI